jgi:hypothetical protein
MIRGNGYLLGNILSICTQVYICDSVGNFIFIYKYGYETV